MTDTATPSEAPIGPPPGWYPSSSGADRFWDGQRWHDAEPVLDLSDAATAAPDSAPDPATGDPAHDAAQDRTSSTAPDEDDLTLAALAHGLAALTSIVGPAAVLLMKGDRSTFVRSHAIRAFNFAVVVAAAVLLLALVDMPRAAAGVFVIGAVFHGLAARSVGRGESNSAAYPVSSGLLPEPSDRA